MVTGNISRPKHATPEPMHPTGTDRPMTLGDVEDLLIGSSQVSPGQCLSGLKRELHEGDEGDANARSRTGDGRGRLPVVGPLAC